MCQKAGRKETNLEDLGVEGNMLLPGCQVLQDESRAQRHLVRSCQSGHSADALQ